MLLSMDPAHSQNMVEDPELCNYPIPYFLGTACMVPDSLGRHVTVMTTTSMGLRLGG